MYSKREICFTVILAIAALWYLGPQHSAAGGAACGPAKAFADGGHPPPPPPPSKQFEDQGVLQADGGHPPPPPWISNSVG